MGVKKRFILKHNILTETSVRNPSRSQCLFSASHNDLNSENNNKHTSRATPYILCSPSDIKSTYENCDEYAFRSTHSILFSPSLNHSTNQNYNQVSLASPFSLITVREIF